MGCRRVKRLLKVCTVLQEQCLVPRQAQRSTPTGVQCWAAAREKHTCCQVPSWTLSGRKSIQRAGLQRNLASGGSWQNMDFTSLLWLEKSPIHSSSQPSLSSRSASRELWSQQLLGDGLLLQAEIKSRNGVTFEENGWKASAQSRISSVVTPARRIAVKQGATAGPAHPLCRTARAHSESTRNKPGPCGGLAGAKLLQWWSQGTESGLPGPFLTWFLLFTIPGVQARQLAVLQTPC